MSEEIKERLSKTEYDRIGDMLLELFADCPYIPDGAKIKYNSKDTGKCVYIITAGGSIKSRDVLGGFTAQINLQIGYKGFATNNESMINSQATLEKIGAWLEDIKSLPRLSGNRQVTKITTSGSFPAIDEVEGDKATIYVIDVDMEYKKEELW